MGIGAWIFLGVVAALVVWIIATYNGLVTVRNRFRNAFSQIDASDAMTSFRISSRRRRATWRTSVRRSMR